ncbi:N-acetyltransferase [Jiella endophytica]|uniref:N-acetyltransferase n=1 Tax=Jiella endophytica TaxID=2558362 RepID=A0A4Y8R9T3_9HYPH|nr:GNAT family N-acetyltransferase [Jiella endophytica]TFF17982.1 N-acetyltransferase [Jiella endophytica]
MVSSPEPLDEGHDISSFSCGKPALDHWLKFRALSNMKRGFTAVIVVHEEKRVVGFYGLSPTAVVPDILPRAIRTGQPPDPVPCLLLGQLATDEAFAGRGIGTGLLRHTLLRAISASQLIGGRALMVRAVDDPAAAFWRRRGFVPSRRDPFVLFRPMADIVDTSTKTAMGEPAPPHRP